MASEKYWRRQMELAGNIPGSWISKASDLLLSSDYLAQVAFARDSSTGGPYKHSSEVWGPMMMLRGMAVECLLKGLAVKSGHRFVVDGTFRHVRGGGDHDLNSLADAVGFAVSETERDILRRLSYFVRAGGRYPLARNWDEGLVDHPEVGKVDGRAWSSPISMDADYSGTDEGTFQALLERLCEVLGVRTRKVRLPALSSLAPSWVRKERQVFRAPPCPVL